VFEPDRYSVTSEEVCNALDWYIPGSGGDPHEILAKNSLSLSALIDVEVVSTLVLYLE